MTVALDHVNIRVTDLARTIAFYVEGIGLTEGWRPPFGFPGVWLYAGAAPVVHVTLADKGSDRAGAGVDHIAFRCDDLEGALRRLAGLGFRFSPPRPQPGTGVRQAFLLDPDGIAVELQGA